MKSFRIHSTHAIPDRRIPYLVMEFLDDGNVEMNFDPLEDDGNDAIPLITVTAQALYEILEGKEVLLSRKDDSVTFCPRGDELLISSESTAGEPIRQYSVWRAEVGLAWNLLG